jgi:beta-lactam-binding protein with PASTA domain
MLAQVVVIPDVRDSTLAGAVAILSPLGIRVVPRDSIVRGAARAIVLRQIPPAGTRVLRASVDTVVIARGTVRFPATASLVIPGSSVTVPNVRDSTYRGAVMVIERVGLVARGPRMSREDSARFIVSDQEPRWPQSVVLRSVVSLRVMLAPRIATPRLVGMDTALARQRLGDSRLTVGTLTLEYNASFRRGVVSHQDPGVGDSIAPGSAVALLVSMGPAPDTTVVLVPIVLGLPLERARVLLQGRGLGAHADTNWVDGDSGLIVHQDPNPNERARRGDVVHVTLAVPPPAIVPWLIDSTPLAAERALETARLAMGAVTSVIDSTKPEGVVVNQSPRPRTRLQTGALVSVEVSVRPPERRVTMPSLGGLPFRDAFDTLRQRSLSVGALSYRIAAVDSLILDQAPAPNTLVAPQTAVDLTIGLPAPPEPLIAMPAVVDSPLERGLRQLDSAGLQDVAVQYEAAPESVLAWLVDSQTPEPGTLVRQDTAVQVVARAVAAIPVPNLLSMTEAEASSAAGREGFRLAVDRRTTALRLFGPRVTRQSPQPGAMVAPGTPLRATVSEPLPLAVRISGGVVLAGLVGITIRKIIDGKLPPPRLRGSADLGQPSIGVVSGPSLVKMDLSLRADPGVISTELTNAPTNLVAKDIIVQEN